MQSALQPVTPQDPVAPPMAPVPAPIGSILPPRELSTGAPAMERWEPEEGRGNLIHAMHDDLMLAFGETDSKGVAMPSALLLLGVMASLFVLAGLASYFATV